MAPAKTPHQHPESLEGSRKCQIKNEILDILGLPRDTAYRDYTRELVERDASLEQIYGTSDHG
jgi:hypothetical protein